MTQQKLILIIEDDVTIAEMCRLVLESEGYIAEIYADGNLALDHLKKNHEPCLVLLDLLMPVMNGWEFMKEFLKLPVPIVPIPVYLFSATKDAEGSTSEMGAKGFIKKPVKLDYLLGIVNDHCKIN